MLITPKEKRVKISCFGIKISHAAKEMNLIYTILLYNLFFSFVDQ